MSVSEVKQSEVYCICRSSDCSRFMIACDNCGEWFHGECVDVDSDEADNIDLFFCDLCRIKHPNLKITYKKHNSKRSKRKRCKKKKKQLIKKLEDNSQHLDVKQVNAIQLDDNIVQSKSTVLAEGTVQSEVTVQPEVTAQSEVTVLSEVVVQPVVSNQFEVADLSDVAVQSEVTIPSEVTVQSEGTINPSKSPLRCVTNRKSGRNRTRSDRSKKNNCLFHCYGPGCTRAARQDSKYCSDDCGKKLATHRLLEILPLRVQQWKAHPSAADDIYRKKLIDIRKQIQETQKRLVGIETDINKLESLICKSRHSPDKMVCLPESDDDSTLHCFICGIEVATKTAIRHFDSCFKREDRHLQATSNSNDEDWNIFCNHRMGKQNFCKKLRVLCPLHYRESKKPDDLCGCPLPGQTDQFCGYTAKRCNSHVGWEEASRAHLDMEKFRHLTLLGKLKEEEMQVVFNMAARGGVLNMMLHETVVH
ncbi:CXXC-type zinc finger protein 1-like [Uloborus diversus]|uniref:CXXC-type zinc finger protein 1-like n=1 Tax=Uloborus diversus TaxID=327109 RepID=UPI00240A4514|nr:CXXC-type zinc finger protein 1-like [Uloborus diversus]